MMQESLTSKYNALSRKLGFEVASGGFWDHRKLVAEILLHAEINLA